MKKTYQYILSLVGAVLLAAIITSCDAPPNNNVKASLISNINTTLSNLNQINKVHTYTNTGATNVETYLKATAKESNYTPKDIDHLSILADRYAITYSVKYNQFISALIPNKKTIQFKKQSNNQYAGYDPALGLWFYLMLAQNNNGVTSVASYSSSVNSPASQGLTTVKGPSVEAALEPDEQINQTTTLSPTGTELTEEEENLDQSAVEGFENEGGNLGPAESETTSDNSSSESTSESSPSDSGGDGGGGDGGGGE